MAIRTIDTDLNIVAALPDEPEELDIDPAELKAKFDESGLTLQTYINGTLIPDIGTEIATEIFNAQLESGNVPLAGATGQILTKVSGTDYDFAWATPAGTSEPTINTYMKRDGGGRAKLGYPIVEQDGATKGYVDAMTQMDFILGVNVATPATDINLSLPDVSIYSELIIIGSNIYVDTAGPYIYVRLNNDSTTGHYQASTHEGVNMTDASSLCPAVIVATAEPNEGTFIINLLLGTASISGRCCGFNPYTTIATTAHFGTKGGLIHRGNLSVINLSCTANIKAGSTFKIYGVKA